MNVSAVLFLLGVVSFTFAQNFESDGVCQPVFENGGQNDGATGYLLFDVSAGADGFFVNDLEFVADVTGEFNVSQVLTFDGSAFSPDRSSPTMIVSANDNLTLTTVVDQPFRLGFTSAMAFEVASNSVVGIQVNFENRLQTSNPPLARFSLADNTNFGATANGDIVRMWGSLQVSSGIAFIQDRIDNVVFHGGVCVTNLDLQIFSASLNMAADEVVPTLAEPDADASATCTVIFDQSSYEVSFSVDFEDLSSPPNEIGLYLPAQRGEAVNQEPQFSISNLPDATSGQVQSNNEDNVESYRINPTQRDLLFNGLWYCQIDTQNNVDGELRAQVENFVDATQVTSFPLTVEALETGLSGDFSETLTLTQRGELVSGTAIGQLVPNAMATAEIDFESQNENINDNAVNYNIEFSDLSGDVTIAHFHRAARNTGQAGTLIDISTNIVNNGGGSGAIVGRQNRLSDDKSGVGLANNEIQDALDGLWYLNLHTAANPAGEVRAQVNRAQATVIASVGSAFATVTTNAVDNSVRLQVEYSGLSSDVIAAEIRGPVSEDDVSENIVLSVQSRSQQGDGSSGVISGVDIIEPDVSVLRNVLAEDELYYYIVLRTLVNPMGELRASIPAASIADITPPVPQSFQSIVPLSVDSEIIALDENIDEAPLGVPDSLLNANSTGEATITYDSSTGTIAWDIEFENLSGLLVAAHLHGPAGITATGGVRVNIPVTDADDMVLPSPLRGSMQISDNFAREALAGFWYVNVHTSENPMTGEIRGQIMPEVGPPDVVIETPPPQIVAQQAGPIPLTRAASIASGVLVDPADDTPDNIGSATVTLFPSNSTLSWEIQYGTLSSAVTLIHFHGPALANETAGVQVTVFNGPAGQSVNPNIGSAVLPDPVINDALADQILEGLWYINIHTENNPMGELRGQVTGFQQIAVDLQTPDIPENTDVVVVEDNSSTRSSIPLLALATLTVIGSISTM